ncbi:MAG: ABC transporter substrate-binding protein [Candidatus Elarobacter sp.]
MTHHTRATFLGGLAAGAAFAPRAIRAASPTVVKIGYIESLSGPFSDVAQRQSAGVQLAVEQANRRGSVRYEVVIADDSARPAEGVNAARRLIEQDKVDAIMIGTLSGTALGVGPIAEQTGIFVLCIQPQDTSITGKNANRVMYRMVPNVRMLTSALSRRLLALGKKWYFLQADFAFGKDGYQRLSSILTRAGGTESGHDVFPLSTTDFSSELTKIRNSDADVLMICHGGVAGASICKQMVQFGLHKRMHVAALNMEDYYQDLLPLDELAGSTFGIMWSPSVSDSAQKLARTLSQSIRGQISQRHYLGYIAASQLIDRMNAAGTTRADAIVDAFADHRFDAAKLRPSTWRACDHQCEGDVYAGTLVSRKRYAKTGLLYDIGADVSGAQALGPCTEPDAAAANVVISGQHVPARPNYEPKSTR